MCRREEAEAVLGAASMRFSQSQEINRALGELALERERWDEASRCFQECLEQHEADWADWLGLGKALLRSGYLPQALNCYQRAASLSGGGAAVRVALGEARELLARQTPAPA
jgi:uncharacterized protein HemY